MTPNVLMPWLKMCQNGLIYLVASYFSIFLMISLIDGGKIFGKILACPKMGQNYKNGLSVTIFSLCSIFSLTHWTCHIFCMKLRDHEYSKLREPSFLRKFLLDLSGVFLNQKSQSSLG